MEEYRDWYRRADGPGVDIDIIADDANGEYLLMRVGWEGETRIRRPVFYLRIRNEKIWIEEDWTQESVASELMRAGVPNGDIVLAFNPPSVRHLTEFAVA